MWEKYSPNKKGNVFLTLLMMSIYDQPIVQIQDSLGFASFYSPAVIVSTKR